MTISINGSVACAAASYDYNYNTSTDTFDFASMIDAIKPYLMFFFGLFIVLYLVATENFGVLILVSAPVIGELRAKYTVKEFLYDPFASFIDVNRTCYASLDEAFMAA